MREIIFDKITAHVVSGGYPHYVDYDTSFAQLPDLDSLKIMDMLMDLEDSFDCNIPINIVADIKTLGELVDVVYNRTQDSNTVMV
jgi:acyl carrier protein